MRDKIRMGGNAAKLRGRRFGRLTVSHAEERDKHGHIVWECQCDCGATARVSTQRLTSGNTTSCGCARSDNAKIQQEQASQARLIHGLSGTPEYYAWWHAKERCHNPEHPSYRYYGARGIRMCVSWRESAAQFYEDMGARPAGLSLDRIDNDGNYEPANCRWATLEQQQSNKRQRGKANASRR